MTFQGEKDFLHIQENYLFCGKNKKVLFLHYYEEWGFGKDEYIIDLFLSNFKKRKNKEF